MNPLNSLLTAGIDIGVSELFWNWNKKLFVPIPHYIFEAAIVHMMNELRRATTKYMKTINDRTATAHLLTCQLQTFSNNFPIFEVIHLSNRITTGWKKSVVVCNLTKELMLM